MSKSLSASLSQFVSQSNEETEFDDPFLENYDSSSDVRDAVKRSKDHKRAKRKKEKEGDKLNNVLSQGEQLLGKYQDDLMIDDFDGFLEHYFLDDEDVEMRQSLVKYGRQYARDTQSTAESSEVNKAYAKTSDALSKLLAEVEHDSDDLQKDIVRLRMAQSMRNNKAISELAEIKAQYQNIRLGIIKEQDKIAKDQFDIKLKVDKQKADNASDDSAANRAIQQLFSMGRDGIMESLGGYGGVSGAIESSSTSDEVDNFPEISEDAEIQKRYFSNDDHEETDGDKFIKYEGMGVHYVLLYDDDDYREIIAEDRDGNLIPDYPTPNASELDFELSISTNTATDNLAQQYELRHV